ncbi:MAG: hydroxyacylglutathione hydrolase [Mariprofundaceae bacterium]|nr:hydroxyacylglutathione hydrolase [Mariprofundaceae bacterium]
MWTYQHQRFRVYQIPVLRDNYVYIIEDCHSEVVLVVDPSLAEPIIQSCNKLNITPTHIINTHHHWDHTDGNLELVQHFHCEVVGNMADAQRIPGISMAMDVPSQPSLTLGALELRILDVPGHTLGHIAYVIDDALFCGDTLFGAGCGRLFEGTPTQMWSSLQQLAALDDATQVYCAHEYTLPNLRFARNVDAENTILKQRIHTDTVSRRQKQPTIPSSIALEKQTNPFLRPLDAEFCAAYNQQSAATEQHLQPLDIFTELRQRKNKW